MALRTKCEEPLSMIKIRKSVVLLREAVDYRGIVPVSDVPPRLVRQRIIEGTAPYDNSEIHTVACKHLTPGRSHVLHGYEIIEDSQPVHIGPSIYENQVVGIKPVDQVAAPAEVVIKPHGLIEA